MNITNTKKMGIVQKLKDLFENSIWLASDLLENDDNLPPELLAVRSKWDEKEKTLGNRGESSPKEINLMRANVKVQKGPRIKEANVEKAIQKENDEFIKE